MLSEAQVHAKLAELLSAPGESECVEWKEAKNSFDPEKLGEYFSALSNEANLNGKDFSWLVLGVRNDKTVCGCRWKEQNRTSLDALKHVIAQQTIGGLTFVEIYEVQTPDGRVVMFQIPPAPQGIPVPWKGHYYARDGESIVALNIEEFERIRRQARHDWSAEIIEGATLNDLDSAAIAKARKEYAVNHSSLSAQLAKWDDTTFLNKANVLRQGRITRTALILLGRSESSALTGHTHLTISWILHDAHSKPIDYQHFSVPFILAVDEVLGKIRNLTYRYLPNESLFPQEISTYDHYVIREALHNCIAHQDYILNGKINVVEKPDELLFANVGSFLPGSVEAVVKRDAPSEQYRNSFLAEAMVNLNMIDIIGSGIKRMFEAQRERFFPLPEYDLSDPRRVEVRIMGKVLNQNYSALLRERPDLDLSTVMLLDMVQKRKMITKEAANQLKGLHLVEGRFPVLFISSLVAVALDQKAEYVKHRPFDDAHYEQLIISYLEQFGSATRDDLRGLLFNKFSDVLIPVQKESKLHNLLERLKYQRIIVPKGGRKFAKWYLYQHEPTKAEDDIDVIVNN